jgi:hypothetical protein
VRGCVLTDRCAGSSIDETSIPCARAIARGTYETPRVASSATSFAMFTSWSPRPNRTARARSSSVGVMPASIAKSSVRSFPTVPAT